MKIQLEVDESGLTWRLDTSMSRDISTGITFDPEADPSAFGLPFADARPIEVEEFIGDIQRGGSVNCSSLTINPHGNGTHTECVGHITKDEMTIADLEIPALLSAWFISVSPVRFDDTAESYPGTSEPDDLIITKRSLQDAIDDLESTVATPDALLCRTRPNDPGQRHRNYTGMNPPYLTGEAVEYIKLLGIRHLVVDLPSIDRENDGGGVPNHRSFWAVPESRAMTENVRRDCTITELVYVPDDIRDGEYVMNLQTPNLATDAVPSRPVLFPISQ